jgi:hypothetical protein
MERFSLLDERFDKEHRARRIEQGEVNMHWSAIYRFRLLMNGPYVATTRVLNSFPVYKYNQKHKSFDLSH